MPSFWSLIDVADQVGNSVPSCLETNELLADMNRSISAHTGIVQPPCNKHHDVKNLATQPMNEPKIQPCQVSLMELRVGGKFRLGRKIGSGSFGDIYIGTNVAWPGLGWISNGDLVMPYALATEQIIGTKVEDW